MVFTELLKKYQKEVKEAVDELFEVAYKNQKIDTELLLVIIHGFHDDKNLEFFKREKLSPYWILEVDEDEGTPEREIGLDDKGNVMMIMPWKDNYGFWTDSSVRVDELAKSRDMTFGDKEEFERLWDEFGAKIKIR